MCDKIDYYPKVSVIVITYNSSYTILDTLESIKDQTYSNIELIVSDDGSKDNTVEICIDWIERNKNRFCNTEIVVVKDNTGIPANCNRGVAKANGEWIKIIAGDDIMMKFFFDIYLEYIRANSNVLVCASNMISFRDNFENKDSFEKLTTIGSLAFAGKIEDQYDQIINKVHVFFAPTFLTHCSIYDIFKYDEKYKQSEDVPFQFYIAKNRIRVHFIDEYTIYYRISEKSISNNLTNKLIYPFYRQTLDFYSEYLFPVWNKKQIRCYKYDFCLDMLIVNSSVFNINNKFNRFFRRLLRKLNPFR